jgi:hypothetical protein
MNSLTTGGCNTAIGCSGLRLATTGTFNNTMGYKSLYGLTTGCGNIALGRSAISDVTSASNNVAIGNNTVSGNFSNSVILGKNATATANNQFVVGSTGYNVGAVTTETVSSTRTWSVVINGVARKILLA